MRPVTATCLPPGGRPSPAGQCLRQSHLAGCFIFRGGPSYARAIAVCCSHTLRCLHCLQLQLPWWLAVPTLPTPWGSSGRMTLLPIRLVLTSCRLRVCPCQVIRENQVVVVVGETGSGKTTQMTQVSGFWATPVAGLSACFEFCPAWTHRKSLSCIAATRGAALPRWCCRPAALRLFALDSLFWILAPPPTTAPNPPAPTPPSHPLCSTFTRTGTPRMALWAAPSRAAWPPCRWPSASGGMGGRGRPAGCEAFGQAPWSGVCTTLHVWASAGSKEWRMALMPFPGITPNPPLQLLITCPDGVAPACPLSPLAAARRWAWSWARRCAAAPAPPAAPAPRAAPHTSFSGGGDARGARPPSAWAHSQAGVCPCPPPCLPATCRWATRFALRTAPAPTPSSST